MLCIQVVTSALSMSWIRYFSFSSATSIASVPVTIVCDLVILVVRRWIVLQGVRMRVFLSEHGSACAFYAVTVNVQFLGV